MVPYQPVKAVPHCDPEALLSFWGALRLWGDGEHTGPLFFSLLSHVNLDDVAGVAPVPSPTSGDTWMWLLGLLT